MRIPDVEGLKDAHDSLNTSNITVPEVLDNDTNATESSPAQHGQPRSFGRAAAVLSAANGTSRTTHAQKGVLQREGQLNERQSSCASGKAFYRCQNGFTGCCSVNPCNPGSTCPDGQEAGDEAQETTSRQGGRETSSTTLSGTRTASAIPTRTTGSDATATSTRIRTASPTGRIPTTTSRQTPRPTTNAAPNCPTANGREYRDSFQIPYRIRCNSDNTYQSFDSIAVGTGGYDQCFSACSQREKCAGFTYVGLDSGNCYLKAQMPNGTYEAKQGNNYISCAKLNPNDSAGNDPDAKEPAKSSTGAIVGGVVGGVAFLGLLILLIALIAKRRRKRIDRRRGTVTHVFHGPIEMDMTQRQQHQYQPGHQRQGSTSHDVFTPYGGNVYDPRTHTRQRSIYGAQTWV